MPRNREKNKPIQIGDTISTTDDEPTVIGTVEAIAGRELFAGGRWHDRTQIIRFLTPEEMEREKTNTNTGRERAQHAAALAANGED